MNPPKPKVEGSSAPVEAAKARSTGQVPGGDPTLARLCFLSPSGSTEGEKPDWEAIEGAQRRLADLGVGLAIGMEPAERSALGHKGLAQLVRRTGALSLPQGFVAGASSEPAGGASSLGDHIDRVVEQASHIEEAGGVPLLLPLAFLSKRRVREEEYVEIYRTLLARLGGPLLIDWTGPALRPELLDYFPGRSFERVMALDPTKVRGVRLAQMDVMKETRIRRELLKQGQLVLTSNADHLSHLLLGAHPGTKLTEIPEPQGHTDLAGRSVALGEFSHALLALPEDPAKSLAKAIACIGARDLAGYLKCFSMG